MAFIFNQNFYTISFKIGLSYSSFLFQKLLNLLIKSQNIFYLAYSLSSGTSPRRISINFPTSAHARLDSGINSIAI